MIKVVGVRFKKAGKIYYFDPGDIEIEAGQAAIVETARGVEYGNVVVGPKEVEEEEIVLPLKQVLRVASEDDRETHEKNQEKAREAFGVCLEKIKDHNLEMKLIDVEYTFDNNKVIFYFTADGRVDFRELVKDLASVFRTRIELRQIGVRDEAKMVNGIGPCGFGLCCANWLGDFAPVSIRMAKDQNLSLNPTKISGICGRLMCCLRYEHENYVQIRSELPKRNEQVWTREGKAVVVDNIILKEAIKARAIVNEETGELGEDIIVAKRGEYCKEGGSCNGSGNCPHCLHMKKEEEEELDDPDAFTFDFSKLQAFEEMMSEEEKQKSEPKKSRNKRGRNRRSGRKGSGKPDNRKSDQKGAKPSGDQDRKKSQKDRSNKSKDRNKQQNKDRNQSNKDRSGQRSKSGDRNKSGGKQGGRPSGNKPGNKPGNKAGTKPQGDRNNQRADSGANKENGNKKPYNKRRRRRKPSGGNQQKTGEQKQSKE